MYNDINKIYEMLYSHIITPYNLLENAKLTNYSYVKYYRGDDGLISEMRCVIEGELEESTFYYYFDNEDKLKKVTIDNGREVSTVFERQTELQKALEKYYQNKKVDKSLAI